MSHFFTWPTEPGCERCGGTGAVVWHSPSGTPPGLQSASMGHCGCRATPGEAAGPERTEGAGPTQARRPDPWYVERMTADEFLLGVLSLGAVLEVSLVGAFDDPEAPGRGSRRDVDLPPHHDGVYSAALAAVQGGHYVERPGIDAVGLYCLRGGRGCLTTVAMPDGSAAADLELRAGEALVLDNRRVMHGRRGAVGGRVLLRAWVAYREGT